LMKSIDDQISTSLQAMRKEWGSYLALGVILFLTGCYALYAGEGATSGAVIAIATVLIIAGLVQVLSGFMVVDTARHVFFALFVGMLDIVVGILLLEHPAVGIPEVGTQLAMLFMFGGVYRFVVAGLMQFPQYAWFAFSGLLSLILGVLLWHWPDTLRGYVALAVGLNFIFAGIAWSALAWRLRSA
jgi:membrane protein HdeD